MSRARHIEKLPGLRKEDGGVILKKERGTTQHNLLGIALYGDFLLDKLVDLAQTAIDDAFGLQSVPGRAEGLHKEAKSA